MKHYSRFTEKQEFSIASKKGMMNVTLESNAGVTQWRVLCEMHKHCAFIL